MISGFADAIAQAGLGAPEIITDGALHRFHVEGDRSGTNNGWYVAHANGVPAGAFGSWKTGLSETWSAKAQDSMTPLERAAYRKFTNEANQKRKIEQKRVREAARVRAQQIWNSAAPVPDTHPYLRMKGVKAHGLRIHNGRLVVPLQDEGGNLHSLQFISEAGDKRFLSGGTVRGHHYALGKPLTVIYICEGFATAATAHEITGQMAVTAFNTGNLHAVAETINMQHPGIDLVIAADNDAHTEGNPGVSKAQEAAKAVGALLAVPQLANETTATDFNDLCRLQGREEARKQLEGPVDVKDALELSSTPNGKQSDKTEERRLIDELAALDLIEYDQRRQQAAKQLGCRRTTLDKLSAQRREELKRESQVSCFEPNEVEPWPERVNGADLLDEIADTLTRFAVLPEHAETTIALWIMFAYLHEHAYVCPMLGLMSPEKRCGKTTLIGLIATITHRPLAASNISTSALFRAVERWQPCLLIDEADTFIHTSNELRGVLNSGHTRDTAFVVRTVGDNYEPTRFSTWCPKVFALIGKLPDTLQDRSIVIWLERKTADQKVEKRRRHHAPELLELRRRAARWATDNAKGFESAEPLFLDSLNDRAADNWEPLLQLAELAGGNWPEQAHKAAAALSSVAGNLNEDSIRIELLADIRRVFQDHDEDQITSHVLANRLEQMEDRPWPEFRRGNPITQVQIARLLKPFSIKPKVMRFGAGTSRGYGLDMFFDAFSRYLP